MYDPYDVTFSQQEDAIMKFLSDTGDRIGSPPPPRRLCSINNGYSMVSINSPAVSLRKTIPTFDVSSFAKTITASSSGISALRSIQSGRPFEAQTLARKWGIDIQTARWTVDVTMQRGVRTVLHPTLSRRFRTNDRQLRYRRLPVDCFTDTLIASTTLPRNNKYAQIFATSDGWCRAFPMQK
jgi:hypothetical protein